MEKEIYELVIKHLDEGNINVEDEVIERLRTSIQCYLSAKKNQTAQAQMLDEQHDTEKLTEVLQKAINDPDTVRVEIWQIMERAERNDYLQVVAVLTDCVKNNPNLKQISRGLSILKEFQPSARRSEDLCDEVQVMKKNVAQKLLNLIPKMNDYMSYLELKDKSNAHYPEKYKELTQTQTSYFVYCLKALGAPCYLESYEYFVSHAKESLQNRIKPQEEESCV